MQEPEFDTGKAARWFAIELNNATWAWLDDHPFGGEPTDPADPVVHGAHASMHHWTQVGTVVNQARAACLVANVHSRLMHGEMALVMANECLRLTTLAGDEAADWDVAFAHDALARALAAAGDIDAAAEERARARSLGDAVADPDDKQVFDDWFALH